MPKFADNILYKENTIDDMTLHPKIIGRQHEINLLKQCYESGKPEMVIVYGRRRVGKTFLIKKMFAEDFTFYMTGIYKGTTKRQLENFAYSLSEFSGNDESTPSNWTEAFRRLKDYLKSLPREERKVIFIDELPWLDSKRNDLLVALEMFWNGWANDRDDIMLILCGSATSWITDKLFGNRGGLFNRDTLRLYISPFTLLETEKFLQSKDINATRYEIAEYYMVMGGIPYYLDKIQRGYSVAQNIDMLFFRRRSLLWNEFDHLYRALFRGNDLYIDIVRLLGTRREGFTRDEIASSVGLSNGGSLSKYLNDLCNCDLIMQFRQFGNKEKQVVYRLSDFYTLFYLRFVENNEEENFWCNNLDNPERRSWTGYAFEMECMWHIPQIKESLGINGISTEVSTYRKISGDNRAQIDLIIDRRDNVLNLCEIKYSNDKFSIDLEYEKNLLHKKKVLESLVSPRKSICLTMITTFGLREGKHTDIVDKSLTLDDLFR